ncbi:hypothetical protein PAUR_a3678 [Pseudoalteromonas aurantia 208]|uniref:Orphan protein n=1 Tax=Pseudoalteromonas aurantia 208 TaxID=1314867 RepID=A0ABR9EA27_9GAMM|nr:hypothetical protein [Pseudoalteromonas aurantia 208]
MLKLVLQVSNHRINQAAVYAAVVTSTFSTTCLQKKELCIV